MSDSNQLTAPLGSERVGHTATLLEDGRVLVVGGLQGPLGSQYGPVREASSWAPGRKRWTRHTPPGIARAWHTATLLEDGRVLVTGGVAARLGPLASAEVWDPETDQWRTAGAMSEPREGHAAVLLEDGRVLVVGGTSSPVAEVWDPGTGRWRSAGRMRQGRRGHTATRLADGRVLVLGGRPARGGGAALASSELWEPGSSQWRAAVKLRQARESHTATRLLNGRILVVGGYAGGYLNTCELLDAAARRSSPAAKLHQARREHSATRLPDGRVLIAGGQGRPRQGLDSVEAWMPDSEKWKRMGRLREGRSLHTATPLDDGRVLFTGGYAVGPIEARPSTEVWSSAVDTSPSSTGRRVAPTRRSAMKKAAAGTKRPRTKQPGAAKPASRPPKRAPEGYHFDVFAQAIAREAAAQVARKLKKGERLDSLRLLRHPLSFWPEQLLALVEGRELQLPLEPGQQCTSVPGGVDAEDPVLAAFIERHPELDGALFMSGFDSLPGALWHAAWHDVATATRAALEEKGVLLGPRFQVRSSTFEQLREAEPGLPMKQLLPFIRKELKQHFQDDATLREFAELCYRAPEKQAWLQKQRDA